MAERAKKLKVGAGNVTGVDVGPLISKEAKERVLRLIQSGADQGATLVLDGRKNIVCGCGYLGAFTNIGSARRLAKRKLCRSHPY